ncbi:MAG: hypothetical protein AAGE43_09835 [Pseudomonadota bacterium]
MLESALERGPDAFESFVEEPRRGGWWGRLATSSGTYFVKGRKLRDRRRQFASLLLPRGLEGEWRQLLWFLNNGLATAAPVALLEYRWLGMLQLSVLITGWVPNSRTFAEAMTAAEPEARNELLQKAGDYLGTLYCKGVLHRQPHAMNLLLVDRGPSVGEEVLTVDLKHAWISDVLDDDDFLWWLEQSAYWLRPPKLDWTDPVAADSFYRAAVRGAAPALSDPARIDAYVDRLIQRGGRVEKRHRQNWQPADTPS